jgi:excisionase family DNA binding protein
MNARNTKDGSESTHPRLLSIASTAETCGVSKRSVWRLLAAKELAAVRLGRSVRITAESVNALVARGGTTNAG